MLSTLSLMGQNPQVILPADGDWPTVVGDSIMLIGPKQEALTEEQRYFNPPYLLVYPGKEHLKNDMIRAAICDCNPANPNRRIGVFSVSGDKKVSFSQGNLQYLPAANIWKFADTQYEYLGNANKYLKPTFRNWVDLFGWSANNTTAPFGVSTSTNNADYAGDFVDWGMNEICGDMPNTWRTLSKDEWEYLINKRANAKQLRGVARVHDVNGLILLPDNWITPAGISFTSGTHAKDSSIYFAQVNDYTLEKWQLLEESGAVFLPTAGVIRIDEELRSESRASYWSSTGQGTKGYILNFHSSFVVASAQDRYGRRSVRLVHDTIVSQPIPEPCLVVKVNDTLSINMMCVEGGTFTMGDDNISNASPAHQVTLSDYYIGETEVTQALWKAVMGNIPTGNKNPSHPVGQVTYADCQDFITKLNNLTGLYFQLPTEAEWEYAAMGGNKGHGYIYSGSNTIDDVAWYDQNSENTLHNVGAKQPNELGIYDMSGNAWEWCADYYGPYSTEPQTNPQGPATGTDRVIRSGSFRTTAERCSNKHRQSRQADYPDVHISFRLVLHDTVPTPEPEYVDLGLSVKWATFNVGATSPEDYGDYFAWGETEPKEEYSWATYKWGTSSSNLTKYNATDGKTILDLEDDAAYVQWGDKWRMPSKEEVDELTQQCSWIWTTHNNVNGYKVTGPNGNSIFLPAVGYKGAGPYYPAGKDGLYWTKNTEEGHYAYGLCIHDDAPPKQASTKCTRCLGFAVRPVYDDRVTLTVIPTPEDAKVSFLCTGYQAQGHSITVDKGKDVLYQVSNVDAGYLSQGDSIYNLTKDSVLHITLRPFSDGNWVKVDKSEYTKQEGYYVSRNNGGFASHSVWNYYVLPVLPGETYRVRSIAGQHAALWMAASTAPDLATNTRPTKISCCANRGVAAYVADEVTIPDGAKYLIINSRNGQEMMVERKVPDPCLVVKVNDTLSINMMCVEGGTFMMGAMEGDTQANANEKPAHEVTLTYDYYIGQTEVTQALWKAVMGYNHSTIIGDNLPVNNVLWGEAQTFVYKLNQITGLSFDLPTEAEWEYAARGGKKSKGYLYAGSNKVDEVAWYNSNSGGVTHPVAQKMPNELGIYDMSGNVWEWCSDWLAPYTAEAQLNPTGPATGECHVYHGGGWDYTQSHCRSSHRRITISGYVQQALGLRVVLREKVEPEYVDLGLSVKWATFNVGATSPEDYGDYFAWGETEPKEEYTWENYKWCDGTDANITKYNATDGKTILEPADDAAHVHWGGNWRMPTKEEQKELLDVCSWERTNLNGAIGYKVTGPNGNSIFIPIAGAYNSFDNQLNSVGSIGWIYSSTRATGKHAYQIHFEEGCVKQMNCSRCVGLTIRPVYDDSN